MFHESTSEGLPSCLERKELGLDMSFKARVSRFFDRTIATLAALGGAVIVFINLIVCWDVIMRYAFGTGERWVLEVVEYGLLWFTLLGGAWVLKGERHVALDTVLLRLTRRARACMNLITSSLASVACLIVTWFAVLVVFEHIRSGERLPTEVGPPKFLPYLILPIGFAFLFVQFVRRTYGYIQDLKSNGGGGFL